MIGPAAAALRARAISTYELIVANELPDGSVVQ